MIRDLKKNWEVYEIFFYPQAVGFGFVRPIQFYLCSRDNFTVRNLQNGANVICMSQALISNLFFSQNFTYFYKLRHRLKVLENFCEFIYQERHIEILI